MAISSIAILGGDLRQCHTAEYLNACGCQVTCYHTPDFSYSSDIIQEDSLSEALMGADVVLAPTPLSKDGAHLFQANSEKPLCLLSQLWDTISTDQIFAVYSLSSDIENLVKEKGFSVLQFSRLPIFSRENALLTAEGLLSEVIRYTPISLSSSRVLLLGYGCCGSAICTLLHPLCRSIYVLEEEVQKQEQAEKKGICPIQKEDFSTVLPHCNIVINTIPLPVLESDQIQELSGSCYIFDIASPPFGFSEDITEKYLLPYFRLPGLPGRFSPVTSGQIIGKIVERITDYVL
ncbi:dipicolinic acid synthetase, A subunit [Lachnospiraceae bacterium 3-1]|nr:dipicolinic acid synthetase, A subunit [Lachnospiraceae bacterium 3-1]